MSDKTGKTPSGNRRDEKLLEILEISQKMNSERDPSALLELMAHEATRVVDADRASIFLLDRERCELLSQVAIGSPKMLRFDARLGIAGAAAMTGETINVPNAQEDLRFYPKIDSQSGYRTRSVLAVPMRNNQSEIIGTFEVLNKIEGVFGKEDEEILTALAAQAAIAIGNAQMFQDLQKENTQLRLEAKARSATLDLLGTSSKIQRIVRLINTIAESSVNVLITGESGTGKELVAKAIHSSSPRADQPFVAVNSAALPESLVETELFGIERGVATGVEARTGKFEEAHQGTLFLDEVGDLSLSAQAKILRAVQEHVLERVGGRKSIEVDVRLIAATNKNLEEAIKKGEFREDLFYRLKVVHIQTPALREIREDIPLLANHFLKRCCQMMGRPTKQISNSALRRLVEYSWPGNVRELENEMERLSVSVRRNVIEEEDLAIGRPSLLESASSKAGTMKEVVAGMVAELERKMIREALESSGGNQQKAAKALGLSRQGLIKKMKRYGVR